MTWTVLVADDQTRMRRALKVIINSDPAFRVVGEAADGAQAAEMAQRLRPDLVLMDVRMHPVDGIEGTRLLKEQAPEVKVLALTAFAQEEWLVRMLQAGASGYLAKESTRDELVSALHRVLGGDDDFAFSPSALNLIGRFIVSAPPTEPSVEPVSAGLSDRELEMVGWLAQGLTNRQIGRRMGLAESSVKVALGRIMAKLEVRDRLQLAIRCQELGLVRLHLADGPNPAAPPPAG